MKYLKRIILLLCIVITIPLLIAFFAITFYKKELTDLLITKAKSTYGLSIKVEDTHVSLFENWPKATIQITDVIASSDLAPKEAPPLFKAQSISVSFDFSELFHKSFVVNSVSLRDGAITLVKNKTGITNYKLLETSDTAKSTSSLKFNLQKINLENVKLDFKNEEKDKHIGVMFTDNVIVLKQERKMIDAQITGNITIEELLFKPAKGSFLKNTAATVYLNTRIFPAKKSFLIDETSYALIDEEKYALKAFVNLENEKTLMLNVKSPTANYTKVRKLMNAKIQKDLAKISVTNPVAVNATIVAAIGKSTDPEFYIELQGKNNSLKIGNTEIPYSQVSFTGHIFSLGDEATTAEARAGMVIFNDIKGFVYEHPFTATVTISDLKAPKIRIIAGVVVQGSKIKFKPGTDFILDGTCKAHINYSGDLAHLNHDDFLDAPQQLIFNVQFTKFSYKTAVDQPAYIISGDAAGLNKDIVFSGLKLETVGGDFSIDGDAKDFVPYAFGFKDGFSASVQATTDFMDLTPMIVKSFNNPAPTISKKEMKKAMKGSFTFDMSIFAKKLAVRFLIAKDAYIDMHYANNTIQVKKMEMKACNGTLLANGSIQNFSNITAHMAIKNMNVKAMFEQFEDFGQSTITSEKLLGNISVNADIKAALNEKFQLKAPALNGQVQLKLKDGHLLNFEPIQRMGTYFRNRDFKDITFSEINQEFKIDGTEMNIENLEIASSVLHLYVDGIYNFKGQTDLNLRIPLNNLKMRDKNFKPKNQGEEGKKSKALLLNAHGLPDKIKITLGVHTKDTTYTE
ncbi:MAG TPA: AsmA-like C-terminal region-containing protein [Bacteroidia bacterium]|jgi:hypothetical protein|nr:AsmA-like C-terminal region-containing protein [Bacteroidia bacterium]